MLSAVSETTWNHANPSSLEVLVYVRRNNPFYVCLSLCWTKAQAFERVLNGQPTIHIACLIIAARHRDRFASLESYCHGSDVFVPSKDD